MLETMLLCLCFTLTSNSTHNINKFTNDKHYSSQKSGLKLSLCSLSLVLKCDCRNGSSMWEEEEWGIYWRHQEVGGGGWRGVCCWSNRVARVQEGGRRGQTGNDEVIAKVREKAGWGGGAEPGGVTLIQRWAQLQRRGLLPPLSPPSLPLQLGLSGRFGCCQCFVVTARDSPATVEWTRTPRRDASFRWHGGRLVFLELLLSEAVETGEEGEAAHCCCCCCSGLLDGWCTAVHEPARRQGGRQSQVDGWHGLPVAEALSIFIFLKLKQKHDTAPCCVVCAILNWVSVLPCNYRSVVFFSFFFLCGALGFLFFFHVMKNWWAMARVLFLERFHAQIKSRI